ncbi:MAG: hypothetical protein OEW21_14140 [Betaproteobacteria bacterium]|nr:hypothetical protein [Betaproteobacteria bacterium]
MLQISAQQLAELLSGIARAQAALLQGIETAMPGTRMNYVVPAIQNAAHLWDRPDPSLADLPVRILLNYMSRVGPDMALVTSELERLLDPNAPVAPISRATAGPAPAPLPAPAAGAGDSLDFSQP